MHIVITGGTGFIGRALVESFQKLNYQITVISRDPVKALSKKIFQEPIRVISWESLPELKNVDAVINLAGENLFSGLFLQAKKERILQSRLTTTQAIVNWIKLQSRPITFISASGINIYPENSKVIYSERDKIINTQHGFMISLARQWEQAANIARSEHCRVVNLRLAVVLDKSGGILAKMLPLSRYFSGVILGSGEQPFSWVALTDVIRAIDFILQDSTIQGPVNAVAPEILVQAEFAKKLAARFNRRCFIRIPALLLKLTMRDLANELILTSPKAASNVLMQHHFQFSYPDMASFLHHLT